MAAHGTERPRTRGQPVVPGEQRTVTIIDGSSGARHDVAIAGEGSEKAANAAPAVMPGIDPRLLEKSRYGMIPMAADGLKPFTAYAGEADRAKAAKMPIVAIVVGGLGVGAAKTVDAILRLPAGGDAGVHALTDRIRPSWSNAPARSITRFCCKFRWNRMTIQTTIRDRRPC